MPTLKVVTINTWKGESSYDIRINSLIEQLQEIKPDLIFFQECFEAPNLDKDTVSKVNKHFNYHLDFLQAREKIRIFEDNPFRSFSNMAILSRLPILNSLHYPFPIADGDEVRFGQEIEFFLENGKTAIATNVHLTHINKNPSIRLNQIETISERIKSQKNKLQIIGGDFNCTYHSPEIKYFLKETNCIESFNYMNPNKNHSSLVEPYLKGIELGVDFLFLTNLNNNYKLIAADICLNKKIETELGYCSDHFGMFIKLKYD